MSLTYYYSKYDVSQYKERYKQSIVRYIIFRVLVLLRLFYIPYKKTCSITQQIHCRTCFTVIYEYKKS